MLLQGEAIDWKESGDNMYLSYDGINISFQLSRVEMSPIPGSHKHQEDFNLCPRNQCAGQTNPGPMCSDRKLMLESKRTDPNKME